MIPATENNPGSKARQISLCCIKLFVLAIMITGQGCTQRSICLDPKVVAMRAGFYTRDTGDVFSDTALVNAYVYFGNSFSFFTHLKNNSKFSLPLSQTNNALQIVFQSDSSTQVPTTIDTITVSYNRDLHFISTACGYETFFQNLSVNSTRNIIDTIIINFVTVDNDVNKEHLKIVIKN